MRRFSSSASQTIEGRVLELEEEVVALRSTVRDLESRLSRLERIEDFEVVDEPPSPLTAEEIERDARTARLIGIGVWLKNSLAGRRGKSGRDSIKEKSSVYLVAKSAKGVVYSPARIFTSWTEAEKVVKDQGGFKSALFVGLPSWQDAEELQEALVSRDGQAPDPVFPLGLFSVPPTTEAEESRFCVVLITEVNSQFLIAVPGSAWHRTVAQRLLPARSLLKPINIAVAASSVEDRLESLDGVYTKCWIGYLNPTFESCVAIHPNLEVGDAVGFWSEDGTTQVLPFAEGLVSVADDKFSFLTAESAEAGGVPDAGQRLAALEESMAGIQSSLQVLLDGHPLSSKPAAKSNARPPAVASAGPSAFPGLDAAVVQSALASGVSAEALETMSRMVLKSSGKLTDFPKKNLSAQLDVLGETDAEAVVPLAAEEASVPALPADPVAAALVRLTSIVETLSGKKRPKSLEEMLDDTAGYDLGTSTASGLGTHRRQAAILTALKRSLVEQPAELYQVIEKKMLEDFGSREVMPGEPMRQGSFRGWLEHRSHIPNIASTVRIAWSVAGALDAMRSGNVKESQARLALLLASLDQVACDRGQWLIAAELSLEPAPPFSSFARHVPPDFQEQPHTRLLDSRWVDAVMYRVKELDEYAERKAKLGKARKGGGGNQEDGDVTDPKPKKKPGKGKEGKGNKGEKSESQNAASST
eukprot:Skav210074  [mRNA]  locus=scaffold7699:11741:13919:+ [translate_table: standard]